MEALVTATGGRFETRRVVGPRPDMQVDAAFGVLGDGRTAVVEMAAASGLALLDVRDRDPMRTTTFGTGQLLVEAAKLGVHQIILGIGGSATVDGGIGCLQACGQPVILDEIGPADVHEPLVGEDLRRVVLVKHAQRFAAGSGEDRCGIGCEQPAHGAQWRGSDFRSAERGDFAAGGGIGSTAQPAGRAMWEDR